MVGDLMRAVWWCATQKIVWRVLVVISAAFYLVYLHSYRATAILLMYLLVAFTVITELTEQEDTEPAERGEMQFLDD